MQCRDITPQVQGCDVAGLRRMPVGLRQVFSEGAEVLAIGLLSQLRGIAFDAKKAEELRDGRMHGVAPAPRLCRTVPDPSKPAACFLGTYSASGSLNRL